MKTVIIFIGGIFTGAFIMEKYRDEILSASDSLSELESDIDAMLQTDNTEKQTKPTQPEA